MNAGLHLNVPAEVYHADPAPQPSLSSSVAQLFLNGSCLQAKFNHPRLNPQYVEKQEDKFDIGRCSHSVLLENDATKIVIAPFDDWRKKEAQEIRKAARAAGKTALLERHYDDVRKMVDTALAFIEECEVAEEWHEADSEVTAIWTEGEVKPIYLRCRPDKLSRARRFCFDYKSTTDASPEAFSRQIVRMGYHFQSSFYRRGITSLTGEPTQFIFLAQSTEPPYECSLHGCDPALQEIADAEVEHAIGLWRKCMSTGEWPTYDKRIHWAMPPSYLINAHELRLAA